MSGLVIICCDLREGNNWFDIASKIAFCTKIEQGVNCMAPYYTLFKYVLLFAWSTQHDNLAQSKVWEYPKVTITNHVYVF